MQISARIENRPGHHSASVQTGDTSRQLSIPPKSEGSGSSVNGGELLFLALATCYCNDLYRETKKRSITVQQVEVEVKGEFGSEGEPARNIQYSVNVQADAPEQEILALIRHTDTVAEIQNTLRTARPVTLVGTNARSI